MLDEVVRRNVEGADPEKNILFGSVAKGKIGPESDLDLLVVKSGVHRSRLAQRIYENLFGIGYPVDVIVLTPYDIEKYKDAIGFIIGLALQEGKVIHECEETKIIERAGNLN